MHSLDQKEVVLARFAASLFDTEVGDHGVIGEKDLRED